ncbi:integrase [Luteimonas sp. FXH3W]|uniref:Integrase n=1 Tax=Aquilutibacter rugosus TaxID=3115820 RepID=A0ABU7V0S9_9GAMM
MILWAKTHARSNGRRPRKGEVNTVPSYLWAALEIAYLCRMRGSEVADINDADIRDDGIYCRRLKGSDDNFTEFSPRLEAAVIELRAQRKAIWERHGRAIPMRATRRPLIVSTTGEAISKGAIDSAWNRMWSNILQSGYLEPEDRFKLHGLKHRGISDTEGTLADAREASGHKTEQMTVRYRHKVSRVKPVK